MSNRSRRIPKYHHYKPKDLGVVRLDGRDHYLGKYDSPESWEKYHRLIAEWLSNGHANRRKSDGSATGNAGVDVSVNRLLMLYWEHARDYYVKEGKPTKELASMREALRPVKLLHGHTAATDFGPKALKLVRQHMVEQGLSRGVINHHVSRIQRVFKWAVAEELISASVHHGLPAVSGLRYGCTTARESEPVEPATDEQVNAVLPFLTPPVVAMISLQRHLLRRVPPGAVQGKGTAEGLEQFRDNQLCSPFPCCLLTEVLDARAGQGWIEGHDRPPFLFGQKRSSCTSGGRYKRSSFT